MLPVSQQSSLEPESGQGKPWNSQAAKTKEVFFLCFLSLTAPCVQHKLFHTPVALLSISHRLQRYFGKMPAFGFLFLIIGLGFFTRVKVCAPEVAMSSKVQFSITLIQFLFQHKNIHPRQINLCCIKMVTLL